MVVVQPETSPDRRTGPGETYLQMGTHPLEAVGSGTTTTATKTGSTTMLNKSSSSTMGRGGVCDDEDDNKFATRTSTPAAQCGDGQSARHREMDGCRTPPKRSSPSPSLITPSLGWAGWLAQDIGTMEMVPTLVLQAFSTGVLDATTYADYLTFASNQTGNTILLCVAAIGTTTAASDPAEEQRRLVLTAISLGTFLLCAAVFGHLGHFMGLRRRGWLLLTNTLQILALVVAAILLSPASPATFRIGGTHSWLALALFAGMSGAQVAQARQSGSQELPTAPMTSSYVDLMADRYLFRSPWHPKAGPRNRRAAYIGAMIAGGMLGAVIHRWGGSWETVVATLGLKVVVLIWTCFLRGERKAAPVQDSNEAEKGLSTAE